MHDERANSRFANLNKRKKGQLYVDKNSLAEPSKCAIRTPRESARFKAAMSCVINRLEQSMANLVRLKAGRNIPDSVSTSRKANSTNRTPGFVGPPGFELEAYCGRERRREREPAAEIPNPECRAERRRKGEGPRVWWALQDLNLRRIAGVSERESGSPQPKSRILNAERSDGRKGRDLGFGGPSRI